MNQELVHRYQDSYRAAASTIRFGNGIRATGCLLGAAGVFMGLIAAANGNTRGGAWIFVGGLLTALAFSVVGVLLAIQGRILRGTLDTAVSSNSTLSQHERAQLMNMDG
jgi:hypothetical protein